MTPLRVLDLFSGLRGWSAPFTARGHETFAIDIDRRFQADAYLDVGDVASVLAAMPWRPDVVLASPPCTAFTTMTMGRNWTHQDEPRTERAREGRRLVLATVRIIAATGPRWWLIENARARLPTLELLEGVPRRTVTYCQYGEERMKPPDLYGLMPPTLVLAPPCRNGALCHVRAATGLPDRHAGWCRWHPGCTHPSAVGNGRVPGGGGSDVRDRSRARPRIPLAAGGAMTAAATLRGPPLRAKRHRYASDPWTRPSPAMRLASRERVRRRATRWSWAMAIETNRIATAFLCSLCGDWVDAAIGRWSSSSARRVT